MAAFSVSSNSERAFLRAERAFCSISLTATLALWMASFADSSPVFCTAAWNAFNSEFSFWQMEAMTWSIFTFPDSPWTS